MENAMNRFDRLDADDDYDSAVTAAEAGEDAGRPQTKAKEGGSLYVENRALVRYCKLKVFSHLYLP